MAAHSKTDSRKYGFYALGILASMMFILLIGMQVVSADLGTYKLGECVVLKADVNASYSGQWNISSITYPLNSTFTVINAEMTRSTPSIFNYSFCNTGLQGNYIYDLYDNQGNTITNSFSINAVGAELTLQKALLYVVLLCLAVILFFVFMWVGLALPARNESDEMTGYVIAVSNMKYLKILAYGFAYLSMVSIFYFSYLLAYAFLDMGFIATLLRFCFNASAIAILPLFIVMVYILIANAVRDHQVAEALANGLRIRDE